MNCPGAWSIRGIFVLHAVRFWSEELSAYLLFYSLFVGIVSLLSRRNGRRMRKPGGGVSPAGKTRSILFTGNGGRMMAQKTGRARFSE
ncbi:MAG: hypothetical protein ACLT8E_06260 [Akkermansia sp.]